MLEFIEYLDMPAKTAFVLVGIFLGMQAIGELLEAKGKIVPEFIKIRKYFKRKKTEREIMQQMPKTLEEVQKTLNNFNVHYSSDNINKRNQWIEEVNLKLQENDKFIKELDKKLDKNNEDTLSLLIDSKRNAIIEFASKVTDKDTPVSREDFKRIFKRYEEYEKIIEGNNLTNGEIDIAYRMITESYENHMKNHTFIEDIRGC